MITQEEFIKAAETIYDTSTLMTKVFSDGLGTDVPSSIDDLSSVATDLLLRNLFDEDELEELKEGAFLDNVYDKLWIEDYFDKEFFKRLYDEYAE